MSEPQPQDFSFVWAWKQSPPLSLVAAGAVGLAVLGLARPAFDLALAIISPTPAALEAKTEEKRQAEQQVGVFGGYVAQIDGRSLFIVPVAPSTPEPTAEVEPEETTPTKPSRYGGPSIIAAINGAVWFSDGSRHAVGEPEKDGLEVLSLNAPWDIAVRWRGVEFTVPIFDRDKTVLPKTPSSSEPASPPEPASEPATDDDPPEPDPEGETPATPPDSPTTPPSQPPTEPAPTPESPDAPTANAQESQPR